MTNMTTSKTKRCGRCREYKNLSEFHKDKRMVDGRHRTCKSCRQQQNKKIILTKDEILKKISLSFDSYFSK